MCFYKFFIFVILFCWVCLFLLVIGMVFNGDRFVCVCDFWCCCCVVDVENCVKVWLFGVIFIVEIFIENDCFVMCGCCCGCWNCVWLMIYYFIVVEFDDVRYVCVWGDVGCVGVWCSRCFVSMFDVRCL